MIFGEQKNKEQNGEMDKLMNNKLKQILNLAYIGYEEFCRSRWIKPS